MDFEIPIALVDDLHNMSICCSFVDEPLPVEVGEFEGDARLADDSWIHLISEAIPRAESATPRWHYHIDLQRSFGKPKKQASHSLSQIQEHLGLANGRHDQATLIQATFRVAVEVLPLTGVIQPFLGMNVSASTAKMALRGVDYSVDNAEVDDLSWKLTKDKKTVEVSLKARRAITVQPQFISDLQKQYQTLFKQLVLEQP